MKNLHTYPTQIKSRKEISFGHELFWGVYQWRRADLEGWHGTIASVRNKGCRCRSLILHANSGTGRLSKATYYAGEAERPDAARAGDMRWNKHGRSQISLSVQGSPARQLQTVPMCLSVQNRSNACACAGFGDAVSWKGCGAMFKLSLSSCGERSTYLSDGASPSRDRKPLSRRIAKSCGNACMA